MNNINGLKSDIHAYHSAKPGDVSANAFPSPLIGRSTGPSTDFVKMADGPVMSRQPRGLFIPAVIASAIFGGLLSYALAGRSEKAGAAEPPMSKTDQFLKDIDAKPLKSDHAAERLITKSLDLWAKKTEQAISVIDKLLYDENYLNDDQKSVIKSIYGNDIFSMSNLYSLKKKYVATLHGLNYLKSHEENGIPVIYIGDFSKNKEMDSSAPAYTPSYYDPSKGRHGFTVFNKQYMDEIKRFESAHAPEELGHLLSHESSHMMAKTDDYFYGQKLPPEASTETALKNADSVAYGISSLNNIYIENKNRKEEF